MRAVEETPSRSPAVPAVPRRAGAARVSGCDATRAAPMTGQCLALGTQEAQKRTGQPPGASLGPAQGPGRGLGLASLSEAACCADHICPVSTHLYHRLGWAQ